MSAADISAHTSGHWTIENLEHRPLSLGLFAIHGITKVKQTVQAIGRRSCAPSH
ncbi:hypothetical protein [Actinomadura roseirufa]|uniref:hypothetical protein n=1 Tax=Actinomadura roseirufa TaxID=2094049 RepID=UPI0013F1523F|nr:hypothetical protein [Actinomadura roseirufa]